MSHHVELAFFSTADTPDQAVAELATVLLDTMNGDREIGVIVKNDQGQVLGYHELRPHFQAERDRRTRGFTAAAAWFIDKN